jgi:hypothetical protein
MGTVARWAEWRYQKRLTEATSLPSTLRTREDVVRFARNADQLLVAGQYDEVIPMYREVVDHPRTGRRSRGTAASILGLLVLGRQDPHDDVPDEARHLLEIALENQPRQWQTQQLAACVYAFDGESAASLQAVRLARKSITDSPKNASLLLAIEAIAHAQLGAVSVAVEKRAAAAALWPGNGMLPDADAAIQSATAPDRRTGATDSADG